MNTFAVKKPVIEIDTNEETKEFENLVEEYYECARQYKELESRMKILKEKILDFGIFGKAKVSDYVVQVSKREVKNYSPEKIYETFGLETLLKSANISTTKLKDVDKEKLERCVESVRTDIVLKIDKNG